jgi:molecular chaperone IbpA
LLKIIGDKQMTNNPFKDIEKYFLGFNSVVKQMEDIQKYNPINKFPTFNIKKKKDSESTYILELLVAGYSANELEVKLDGDILYITGNLNNDNDTETDDELIWGGMKGNFQRTWRLTDDLEVKGTELSNGVLKIFLDHQAEIAKQIKNFEIKAS